MELGRIDRPEAGDLMTRRKAYLVSMVQTAPDADPEFTDHYEAYWRAVDEQVASLELRAGPVNRVLVEGVGFGGEEGLLRVQQADPQAHRLVKSRVDSGAVLEPYEDQDLFEQIVDWGRMLQYGFVSQTVADTVRNAFESAGQKRHEHTKQRLEESIQETEAALIIASSDVGDVLPAEMERFIVSPPELDRLIRWVRDQAEKAQREAEARMRAAAQQGPAGQQDPGSTTSSGLWTPGEQ